MHSTNYPAAARTTTASTPPARTPADPLLTGNEVDAVLGIKKTKRYELLKAGLLPKPVYLGARCVRWRTSAIAGYIDSLGEGSNAK